MGKSVARLEQGLGVCLHRCTVQRHAPDCAAQFDGLVFLDQHASRQGIGLEGLPERCVENHRDALDRQTRWIADTRPVERVV